MRTLLIDGDIIIYKAAFGAEQVHQFDDLWTTTADEDLAHSYLRTAVKRLEAAIKGHTDTIVALTDDTNWRKAIYPMYKAARAAVRRPILLKPLKAWMTENFRTYTRPTLEADDVLGILQTGDIIKGDTVIATIDKDLLQIPGKHLHIDKLTKSNVTEEEGDRLHMVQTLTGDVVDNYPGCPGVGKVTADKILNDPADTSVWERVVAAFEKKGLTEEDALVQARISRICRSSDYSISTHAVIPWSPVTH